MRCGLGGSRLLQRRLVVRARACLVDLDGTLYHALPIKLVMAGELLLYGYNAIGPLRSFQHAREKLQPVMVYFSQRRA